MARVWSMHDPLNQLANFPNLPTKQPAHHAARKRATGGWARGQRSEVREARAGTHVQTRRGSRAAGPLSTPSAPGPAWRLPQGNTAHE